MTAIVQREYGDVEVLKVEDIDHTRCRPRRRLRPRRLHPWNRRHDIIFDLIGNHALSSRT